MRRRLAIGIVTAWLLATAGGRAMPAAAGEACTIIAEADTGVEIHRSGPACDVQASPASTFKLALALIGFETGLLGDADHPAEPYLAQYDAPFAVWRRTTTPATWLRDSVVWYSQILTRKLGMADLQAWVDRFGYGNRDLTGDPGAGNGLTHAWLSSSLKISPEEQIAFLRRIVGRDLPVGPAAYDKLADTLDVHDIGGGWRAQAKTGTAFQRDEAGKRTGLQSGWSVGWAVRDGAAFVFVRRTADEAPAGGFAGSRTQAVLLGELADLLAAGPGDG